MAAAKKSGLNKMTYYFGKTRTDGSGSDKQLLGGKGANLAEMTGIDLPVPPGFTITTEVCEAYYKGGEKMPAKLMDEVHKSISMLEKELGKKFGDQQNPLLVSVRSGAAVSMPGMMNTILNLGLTDVSVVGLANATGNQRFAYDAYRRVINMFGDVVLGVGHEHFEEAFSKVKKKYGVKLDTDVPAEGLVELCDEYKKVFKRHTKQDFPQDPYEQLELGDSCGVRQLEYVPRRAVSRSGEHSRPEGYGGQCAVDGLREYGGRLRNGCCFHARSLHRRK